jgi:hypothetical protein
MPQGQTSVNHLGIVNRNDQPVTVVPDVEDDKTANVVRIGETGSQLLKVPPSRRLHDPDPGAYFPGSVLIFL